MRSNGSFHMHDPRVTFPRALRLPCALACSYCHLICQAFEMPSVLESICTDYFHTDVDRYYFIIKKKRKPKWENWSVHEEQKLFKLSLKNICCILKHKLPSFDTNLNWRILISSRPSTAELNNFQSWGTIESKYKVKRTTPSRDQSVIPIFSLF